MDNATLLLSFNGWMDGGNVSTGTVERLIDLLSARPVAEIDPEPFYILNFPGPMEVAALFRPFVEVEERHAQADRHAHQRLLLLRAGAAAVVRGQGAEHALAGVRRLRRAPGEARRA